MIAEMTPALADGSPDALLEGYEAFIGGRFLADHDRFEEPAKKGQAPSTQAPSTMVISRSDSRVAPEAISNAPPAPNDSKYIEKLEFEAIKQTLRNLRAFPMVQVLEHRKRLRRHGLLLRIMNGRPFLLEEETGAFVGIAQKAYCDAFSGSRS